MALTYTREFKRIIEELAEGIMKINSFYEIFDMSKNDWDALSIEEKFECARTLADDVFYALGKEPVMPMCDAIIQYDKSEGIIRIMENNKNIYNVAL